MTQTTLSEAEKATNYDTFRHIELVRNLLNCCVDNLLKRGELHDKSKLGHPEVEVFTEFTPKLANCTYGSDEYKNHLAAMKPALDHHYAHNSHHPEFRRWHCPVCQGQFSEQQFQAAPQGPNDTGWRYCPDCSASSLITETQLLNKPELGINGMSLFDIIEMVCADWPAAVKRHADGNLLRSLEINRKRFNISDQLVAIIRNTYREMGLIEHGWDSTTSTCQSTSQGLPAKSTT